MCIPRECNKSDKNGSCLYYILALCNLEVIIQHFAQSLKNLMARCIIWNNTRNGIVGSNISILDDSHAGRVQNCYSFSKILGPIWSNLNQTSERSQWNAIFTAANTKLNRYILAYYLKTNNNQRIWNRFCKNSTISARSRNQL